MLKRQHLSDCEPIISFVKVGNVVVRPSVSISCLHVHLTLINPAQLLHPENFPHLAFVFAAKRSSPE